MSSTFEFDFIIVGGGTAGSVLASRLSTALPECKFLVVEAGGSGDPRIEPTQGYAQGMDPSIEWAHRSVPQKGLNGKVVDQAQGKIMGGSSAINVQAWTRGPSIDFDQWAARVNDQRWSWSGLLPYFKKTETFYPTSDQKGTDVEATHGFEGPIKVSHVSSSGRPRAYPLRDTIARAYESTGAPQILDHNSGSVLGFAEVAASTYEAKRYWSSNNYKMGGNVTTWVDTVAERIGFDGKRAISVQLVRNSEDGRLEHATVTARKEILVTSGVQGSAKLFLLSGIGPANELRKHNIFQICDLPVGENYSDHVFFQTFWKLRDRGLSMGDGPLTTPECDWTAGIPCDWMSWHQHNDVVKSVENKAVDPASTEWLLAEGKAHTEMFSMYAHLDMASAGVANPGGSCIILVNVLLSPISRGTLKLQSSNTEDAPLLDPNLLDNELDRQLAISSGRQAISMMHGPIGKKIGAQEYGIDEVIRDDTSDDAIMARILKTGRTCNHGSGTCAMGLVVDSECRVKGIEALRVVDASVFPFPMGAHYQAIVYAVAEQMAQIIIDEQRA